MYIRLEEQIDFKCQLIDFDIFMLPKGRGYTYVVAALSRCPSIHILPRT